MWDHGNWSENNRLTTVSLDEYAMADWLMTILHRKLSRTFTTDYASTDIVGVFIPFEF